MIVIIFTCLVYNNGFNLQGPSGDSGPAGASGPSGPRVSNLPSKQVIVQLWTLEYCNIFVFFFYRALQVPVALLVRMVDLELLVLLDLLDPVVPLDMLDQL